MSLSQQYALDGFCLTNYHLLPGGTHNILQEGVVDLAKDAIQFVTAAVVEYGTAATIAGAPAAPILETIVDAAFTAEGVASTVSEVSAMANQFGEAKDLISKVLSLSLSGGFDAFYLDVLNIWKGASEYFGDKAKDMLEKTKDTIYKFVSKLADTITDALKLLIPDAVIGTAVAEGVEALLKSAAENAYSMLTGIMDKLGKFRDTIVDPAKTEAFFNEAFDWVEDAIETIKNPPESKSTLEKVGAIAGTVASAAITGPTGIMADVAKKKAIEALGTLIANNRTKIVSTAVSVSKVLLPAIFGLLASYQILMKDEWVTEEDEETKMGYQGPGKLQQMFNPAEEGEALRATSETVAAESVHPEYLLKRVTDQKYVAAVSLSKMNKSTPLLEFSSKEEAVGWIRSTLLAI